jgi:hypothetical protein
MSARGDWMGWLLVADDGGDGLEPSGEARVHPILPQIMRTDFEKKYIQRFQKRMRNPYLKWLKLEEVRCFVVEYGTL